MLNGGSDIKVRSFHFRKVIDDLIGLLLGSILHAEAAGNHIVILNRVKDAKELLERRSQIYSNRPRIPMAEM